MQFIGQDIIPFIGQRLDVFLSQKLERSRNHAQDLIKRKAVQIIPSQQKIQASYRLKAGDAVEVDLAILPPEVVPDATASPAPQGEDIPLTILFEDESLLVLNKPPGLVVHPAAGHASGTLVNALIHHCRESLAQRGGEHRLGIVHRLDQDTSGALVVAKTDRAHERISQSFAERKVVKIYRALCWGFFRLHKGQCLGEIGRHPVHRKKMAILAMGGRLAHTDYRVLQQGSKGAEVECQLHTGRTHQIRVHLSALGHPIWADSLYGRAHFIAGFQPARQMLHATRLEFAHPITGKPLAFTADLPTDYREAQKQLLKA